MPKRKLDLKKKKGKVVLNTFLKKNPSFLACVTIILTFNVIRKKFAYLQISQNFAAIIRFVPEKEKKIASVFIGNNI